MLSLEEAIRYHEEVAEELEKRVKPYQCESINKKLYEVNKKEWDDCLECASEHRQLAKWLRELKIYKDKNMRPIYANPLYEAIRCAMCTNPIKSDRGCDGGCKVDEQMYKKVIEAVNELIVEVNADDTNRCED